jgi:hypothetical protein
MIAGSVQPGGFDQPNDVGTNAVVIAELFAILVVAFRPDLVELDPKQTVILIRRLDVDAIQSICRSLVMCDCSRLTIS